MYYDSLKIQPVYMVLHVC